MLYHPNLYDRTQPIGSFWETTVPPLLPTDITPLSQDTTCDVAIIGGGITGLNAALYLAKEAGIQAHVLDAGTVAWGASGRNGGFVCVGATWLTNHQLLQKFGGEEVRRFAQQQRQGTELVRHIAASEGIEIDAQGTGEILVAHRPSRWQALEEEYDFLTEIAEYPCTLWSQKDLAEHAYHSPEAHGALHIGVGFGLNPLKYSRGLANAVRQAGLTLSLRSPVEAWEKSGHWHLLQTPGGTLRAKQVILATNGYSDEQLVPSLRGTLLPVISNIITTRPLTAAELAAQGWKTETPLYDTRLLLFYFRLLKDGRFLLGSRGGTRGDQQERDRQRSWMIRRLGEMFPAWKDVEVTHYWNGLVCGSTTLTPHVGQFSADPSVFYSLAYHGNGVATGTWCGRAIAQILAGRKRVEDLPALLRQPLKRFPLARLRRWYLRSAYAFFGLQDQQ